MKNVISADNGSTNIAVTKFFNNYSFDVIGELGFGMQFNSQADGVKSEFHEAFSRTIMILDSSKIKMAIHFFPFLINMNFGVFGEMKRLHKFSEEYLDEVIICCFYRNC